MEATSLAVQVEERLLHRVHRRSVGSARVHADRRAVEQQLVLAARAAADVFRAKIALNAAYRAEGQGDAVAVGGVWREGVGGGGGRLEALS